MPNPGDYIKRQGNDFTISGGNSTTIQMPDSGTGAAFLIWNVDGYSLCKLNWGYNAPCYCTNDGLTFETKTLVSAGIDISSYSYAIIVGGSGGYSITIS